MAAASFAYALRLLDGHRRRIRHAYVDDRVALVLRLVVSAAARIVSVRAIRVRRAGRWKRVIGRTIGHRRCPGSRCADRDARRKRIIAPAIPIAAPIIVDVDVGVAIACVDAVAAVVDATALPRTLTLARTTGTSDTAYTAATAAAAAAAATCICFLDHEGRKANECAEHRYA